MIIGIDIQPFDELRRLNNTMFKLYLFGSRYFGYARIDSDWDLVAQDSLPLVEYLKHLGYKRRGMHPSWLDNQTVSIYSTENLKIHIVLVKDIKLKLRAMEYIKTSPPMLDRLKVTKDDGRKDIWNHTYYLIGESSSEL